MEDEVAKQREYYRQTAAEYDQTHLADPEHVLSGAWMLSMIEHLGIESVLDLGAGTGRGILRIKRAYPQVRVVAVEPSDALREIGYAKGLSREELIDGDAQALPYPDGSFDMVCEFAVLHHVPDPAKAVAEMLRVARKAVFISDANNHGQGGWAIRTLKQTLRGLGLAEAADYVKTRGKGYSISEGDGLSYAFSVYDHWDAVAKQCPQIYVMNTKPARSWNPYRSAEQVALLGIK